MVINTKPGQPDKFLHLIDERRVGCFMKIFKYFLYQTPFNSNLENTPPSPNPNQLVATSQSSSSAVSAPGAGTGETSARQEMVQNMRSLRVSAEKSKARRKLDKRKRRKKVKAVQKPAGHVDNEEEEEEEENEGAEICDDLLDESD